MGSFLAITLLKCAPSLHGGSSQNMFAEVAHKVILLIYFSGEALRYRDLRDPLLHEDHRHQNVVEMKQMGFK